MKYLCPIILLSLVGCSFWKSSLTPLKQDVSMTKMETPIEDLWIQNGCGLYRSGERKIFPGELCQFLDDGRFVSATNTSLRLFSKAQEVLWEIKGHFHHQVNLSVDKKRILVLSSDMVKRERRLQRDDVFVILDLEGKILARESFFPHIQKRGLKALKWTMTPILKRTGTDLETSHFNSMYEIPENSYSNTVPWLKAGNIIANSLELGVFVFSPDLKKVLHHRVFEFSQRHNVHDIQITQEGEFLIFNNLAVTKKKTPSSAIQKFSGPENRMTLEFQGSPPEMFFSAVCGGVQELGDYIFFSHVTNGGYIYSKSKKEILYFFPGHLGNILENIPTQQLKAIDARAFLKNMGQ